MTDIEDLIQSSKEICGLKQFKVVKMSPTRTRGSWGLCMHALLSNIWQRFTSYMSSGYKWEIVLCDFTEEKFLFKVLSV